MKKDYCVHPGSIIRHILLSINKKQNWLAKEMGISKIIISDLIRGKRNITPKIAYDFEKATGFSAELLLQQQDKYDLFCLQKGCGNTCNSTEIINNSLDDKENKLEITMPTFEINSLSYNNLQYAA